MNDNEAIVMGGLSNEPQFFGDGTAEIASTSSLIGGWNDDHGLAILSGGPWQLRGNRPENSTHAGVFAYSTAAGSSNSYVSHRTILLGY